MRISSEVARGSSEVRKFNPLPARLVSALPGWQVVFRWSAKTDDESPVGVLLMALAILQLAAVDADQVFVKIIDVADIVQRERIRIAVWIGGRITVDRRGRKLVSGPARCIVISDHVAAVTANVGEVAEHWSRIDERIEQAWIEAQRRDGSRTIDDRPVRTMFDSQSPRRGAVRCGRCRQRPITR